MTSKLQLRPLTAADDRAMLDLVAACDLADIGVVDISLEDVRDDLARPSWHGWGLDDDTGGLRALCWTEHLPGRDYVHADLYVRPGDAGDDGPALLAFVRERAAALNPRLPVHLFAGRDATRDRGWLDAAGGAVIRHFWRMAIDFGDAAPHPLELPAGVSLEQPGDDDAALRVVHHVMETAFLDHFGHRTVSEYDEWLARQLGGTGSDRDLWWLARVDGAPAAALIGRAWPEEGYVQGLGTLREFRGRGLARVLLTVAFAEFHRRGYRRVTLSVDAASPTGAVGLYESVGMVQAFEVVLYELPPLAATP